MLEYDDSAFYYFTLTLLSFYILPGTYYLVFHQIFPSVGSTDDVSKKARTTVERRRVEALKKQQTLAQRLCNVGVIANIVCLAIAYAIFIFLIFKVWSDHEIAQFDPYTILEVAHDADDRTIRKAYRQLSLKWHPDKNQGNQYAEQMFMMVRKAYEALTDEAAKENWQKYGNPDGKQALEVSIGLPTFLLNKDNHTIILMVYLVLMVVAVPFIVYCYYAESQQYGEKNIMYRTYHDYSQLLTENTATKFLPSIMVTSNECVKANKVKNISLEAAELDKLEKELGLRYIKPRHENKLRFPLEIKKGNILLHAHLYRVEVSPALLKSLMELLKCTPDLIEAMLEILQRTRWLQTAMNVLQFQQMIVQGVMIKENSDTLFQLPHLTSNEISHIVKGKGSVRSISDYLKVPDDSKKGLNDLDADKKEDVLRVCKMLPRLEVKTEVFVEDEDEIAEGDLITIRVNMTRVNLDEGEDASAVHAPFFPTRRQEGWYLILAHNQTLIAMEKVVDSSRTFSYELKCFGPGMPLEAGHYKFDLHIISDSYCGLDLVQKVEFKVVDAATLPEYKPHPDDVELDDEPTLFESLAGNLEEDSESDVEEEKEDGGDGEGAGSSGQEGASNNNGTSDAAGDKENKEGEQAEEPPNQMVLWGGLGGIALSILVSWVWSSGYLG